MIPLKCIETSEEIFDEILQTMSSRIMAVPSINPYSCGYPEDLSKKVIVYDGAEYMIMQEYLFAYFAGIDNDLITDWKQIKVRRTKCTEAWVESIDGPRATRYMTDLLLRYYTEEELEERYKACSSRHDPRLIQVHASISLKKGVVERFDNCTKYDINGAHHDALIEIFPRAEEDLRRLYLNRKAKPILKKYVNYFVGNMCNHGHRGTYNWIVQRTTKKLLEAINYVGGLLLYANTDGFIVFGADDDIAHTGDIGGFKTEYEGTVCLYRGTNYTCIELSDLPKGDDKRITGSVRLAVRHWIDLANGVTVSYNNVRVVDRDKFGNAVNYQKIDNIKTMEVGVHENSKEDILF